MGLVSLFKKRKRSELPTPRPYEDTVTWYKGGLQTRKITLSGTKSMSTLALDFPASRTVRNKFLLFKPPSLRFFVFPVAQAKTHYKNGKKRHLIEIKC